MIPTLPVIAIRMLNDTVYEVRGSLANQEVHQSFNDISSQIFMTLPGGDTFEKKHHDVQKLADIYTRSMGADNE